jgi:hypothetical protein
MNRCASPDLPHCTAWVAPGESLCAHGHAQPAATQSSVEVPARVWDGAAGERPHLHVSGYDPRAAGGRHAVKLELRGMPPGAPPRLALRLRSDLLADGGASTANLAFLRGLRGEWRPVFIEFSSRGREHGQYRIDAEVRAEVQAPGTAARSWVATLVLLVPRPDATLGEIHQTFLSTHKNVRIHADDAAIARLHGLDTAGPMDIDIDARNGAIAQLQFDGAGNYGVSGGKVDLALPTLAWDEDLIEIDLPAATVHPCPATRACLLAAAPDAGLPRHLRLFALDECVLGRFEDEQAAPDADLLLQHVGDQGPEAGGLTRRLSARHARIRAGRHGFEIEDLSRYGLLLDGLWPGKHKPMPLRLGMRIEFTASIRGVAALVVTALHDHALVLHRVDAGGAGEAFILLAPERVPVLAAVEPAPTALPRAAALPLLFHRDGGIWHLDPAVGEETPLTPSTPLAHLAGCEGLVRFAARSRPEDADRGQHRDAGALTVSAP